jgi:hypothetical protein
MDAKRDRGIDLEFATDHIWTMQDREGFIGLRVDCGDSGVIYFTPDQARQVIDQFTLQLAPAALPVDANQGNTSFSHCPKCGQQVIGGQFLCGHTPLVDYLPLAALPEAKLEPIATELCDICRGPLVFPLALPGDIYSAHETWENAAKYSDPKRMFVTLCSKGLAYEREITRLKARDEEMERALISIGRNSCCESCREAALVARECLVRVALLDSRTAQGGATNAS